MRNIFLAALTMLSSLAYSQEVKREYYGNGNLKIEYKEVNSNPDGLVKIYYESGELQGELNYSSGAQNGKSVIYYPSGKLEKEMTFKDGAQTDTMKIYYESGKLMQVCIVKNNKMEGYYCSYFENGQVKSKGMMKEGLANDYWEHFFENGKPEKKGKYYYGKPVGTWMEYNEIGVTQKKYAEPDLINVPNKLEYLSFTDDAFTLTYPNSWKQVEYNHPGVKFLCAPLTAGKAFKENLSVVESQVDKEYKSLDKFVDYVHANLMKKYPGLKIISESKGKNNKFNYHDVFYLMSNNSGFALISIKSWARYFIVGKIAYQITFACEEEKYDGRIKDVESIVSSFELKK